MKATLKKKKSILYVHRLRISVGKGWGWRPIPKHITNNQNISIKGLKSCPKVEKLKVTQVLDIRRRPQTWMSHLSNSSPLMKSCKEVAPTCLKPSNFLLSSLLNLMLKIISKQKYTHTYELVK